MFVTLEEAKQHLRVDHDEDDEYITSLIEVGESAIQNYINRPYSEVLEDGELPTPLRHAIKIQIAKLYEYREGDRAGSTSEVPFALAALVMPYRFDS